MKHKHLVTAGAFATIAALALSGCGRSDAPSGGESGSTGGEVSAGEVSGTVTVWAMGAEGEYLPSFVEGFTDENPDVTVSVTSVPWDGAHDKIQTAIAGGTMPDLIQLGTTWMTDFANALTPVPDDFQAEKMFEGSVNTAVVDGVQLGVPWYVDTRVVYYRTDLAEEAGWTKDVETWDDMFDLAKAIKDKTGVEYPFRAATGAFDSFQLWMPFYWSAGASLTNEDQTQWTIDSSEGVEAFEYLKSFFDAGLADPNMDTSGGAAEAAFALGESAIMLSGPSEMSGINDIGGDDIVDKYTTVRVPKKVSSTSFAGGGNLVVPQGAKNPEAAWKLAEWLVRPENQVAWNQTAGVLPSTEAAWDAPEMQENPKLVAFHDQLTDTRSVPTLTTWTRVSVEGDSFVERLAKGQVDVAEGLAELQKQAESIGVG